MEKRWILPRVRSEILGWLMPRSFAASDWVSSFLRMKETKARIIVERSRRFSASAGSKPRSAKMLGRSLDVSARFTFWPKGLCD